MRNAIRPLTAGFVVVLLLTTSVSIVAIDQSDFDKTVEQQKKLAAQTPKNPESWYEVAKLYSEKALNDKTLAKDLAKNYVMRGLEADDRALAINPVYYEALVLKNILLRQRAVHETDPAVRKSLIAEADAIFAKALELQKKGGRSGGSAAATSVPGR